MKTNKGDKSIQVIVHLYMETSQEHKEIPCINYLNLKQAKNITLFLFSSTKSENRKAEQVLPRVGLVLRGRGKWPWQGKQVGW
jgi:hypothetical protein